MTISSQEQLEIEEEGELTVREIACLFVGIGAGIAWYRYFIIQTINKIPRTICDYCQFEIQKRQIFRRKK